VSVGAYMVRDLHVSASSLQVVRHVLAKMRPEVRFSREHRSARHEVLRDALDAHQRHQDLVREFRL